MQMQQKLLRRSKAPRAVEVFSPRTTAANIQKNDSRLLTLMILKLTKPTIVKLKHQFKDRKDQIDFITFAKIMGRELVGWEPNIPNRRYQMIRCLYKLFNQIDYLNKGRLEWDQVINFVAQRPLNTANQKTAKNSLKTFTEVHIPNKQKFENSLTKVVYMDHIDKLAIIEENSNVVKFVDPNNGQTWTKTITISPKKLIVSISSLRKTKGQFRKKELQLVSSVRVLDIIYIPGKYKVLLTSTSDKFIRGWRYNNTSFVLSTDFTDDQFLFQKQFPQDIYSMEWDEINQILFCASGKGKLFFYNIQLDLKNQMDIDGKQGHSDMINTMIVVPKLHFVVTGGMDGKVLLWDIQTYKLKEVYKEHTRSISCLAYHAQLILVFSAGFDTSICVWNPYTSNFIFKILTHSSAITTMSILPDSNFLVSVSSEGIMKVTELNKFKTINSVSLSVDEEFPLKPNHMTIIPSKLRLCIVGRSIQMFDYDKTYNPINCDDNVTISCKVSQKKFEMYTIAGNKLKVWNALTGNIEIIHEHQLQITSFVVDKYEKCFIIGDVKGGVSLYNMSNGYKLATIYKGQQHSNNSAIYMLSSIIVGEEWMIIAVNQQNSIFIFKEIYNTLTYIKTLKISAHTNVKSIVHLTQHKLICIATDSEGLFVYQFDSMSKPQHFHLPEIVSIQQILKNYIQITYISGQIKFYHSPPTVKLSPVYEFQHQEEMAVVQSLFSSNKNYVCDQRLYVSCYDYTSLIKVIQDQKYRFQDVKINCLWNVKVASQSIKQMVLVPEWRLFLICSEDKEVKLWNMNNGKYIDALKQNYHKNEPIILMKQTRKTILELENKFEQYDPFFHHGVNTLSNGQWNLFLEFRGKFEEEHRMYYSLLKQLNKQVEKETREKQNQKKQPISLERMEDTKNRSVHLLMKSFHQNVCQKGLSGHKQQPKQPREAARSTIVSSSFEKGKSNCNRVTGSIMNLFPKAIFKSKQSIEAFKSLHQTREFPGRMHRNQKNAFKIHFQTRLNPCERLLHNQSIERLSSTFLKGKMASLEPPKVYLHTEEAIAANKLNDAFEKTSTSLYKSGKIFKNIVVRKSVSQIKLDKTLSKLKFL